MASKFREAALAQPERTTELRLFNDDPERYAAGVAQWSLILSAVSGLVIFKDNIPPRLADWKSALWDSKNASPLGQRLRYSIIHFALASTAAYLTGHAFMGLGTSLSKYDSSETIPTVTAGVTAGGLFGLLYGGLRGALFYFDTGGAVGFPTRSLATIYMPFFALQGALFSALTLWGLKRRREQTLASVTSSVPSSSRTRSAAQNIG